jgi:hypothetical protein
MDAFKKVINIPYAIIISSFVIIIITSNVMNKNALSALIGGYSGLLLGILFLLVLMMSQTNLLTMDLIPIGLQLGLIGLIMYYLIAYYENIAKGEVSSYYSSFMTLSTLLLAIQMGVIMKSVYQRQDIARLFTNATYSMLVLFGLLNALVVITMGIVLKFYTTQG